MNKNDNSTNRILVIDDDYDIRELFKDLFEDFSVNIDTADSGEAGLKMIAENNYNLIYIDINLPGMNGLDVLKGAYNIQPDANYIIISGYLTEDLTEQALKSGAHGYIYKPLSIKDIISTAMRFITLSET